MKHDLGHLGKCYNEKIIKMVEFLLKYYYFEFNGYVKHQILSTAIVTTLESTPLVQFHCIDVFFFIWTHEKDKLELFLIALTIIT